MDGEPKRLLRHSIDNKLLGTLTEEMLRRILFVLGKPIVKFGEKTVTKKSLLFSIVVAECPDLDPAVQSQYVLDMLNITSTKSKKEHVPDELAEQCFKQMPHEEVQTNFKGIKDRLDERLMGEKFREFASRNVETRTQKTYETPQCLKSLAPEWKGASLVMDWGKQAFEGYYPAGHPTKSTSMTWEDDNPNRTMFSCLSFVVQYLWKNQEMKGRVPRLFTLATCFLFGSFAAFSSGKF